MRIRSAILFFYLIYSFRALAQPSNDDCQNAIALPLSSNWCSSFAAFTNLGASASSFSSPTCFGNAGNDVWFSFISVGTDINITIIGNQSPNAGGTLLSPETALYIGSCTGSSTLTQIGCATASGAANIIDLYKGGLIIGQTYLIRVQSNSNDGSFKICAQNYNATALPGSDCNNAAVLCDKSSFVVQSVSGAGIDPDEANNSCLGGLGGNSESNSSWMKWTCDQSGSFVFTLTPNNDPDDLDFVLYELPNGINNCNGKVALRCMAAGQVLSQYPSPCHGPTGLNFTATDQIEGAGCSAGQDNWLSSVNLIAGKSYALMVNNFSATGNGFQVEFGGTATFQGPVADFSLAVTDDTCTNSPLQFIDNSGFAFGNISKWTWTFGSGASPQTANTMGPHSVSYSTEGQKSIVLSVESDKGCIISDVMILDVDNCCETQNVNPLIVDAGPDRVVQLGDSIEVEAYLSFFDWYSYNWYPNSGDISCASCRKTTITPVDDFKTYYVEVLTNEGCISRDSFSVEVEKNRGVYIPNAFSPNADGSNDVHDVYSKMDVRQIKSYRIFDRWGELIFQKNNIPRHYRNFGWDGKFKGKKMNTGVYIYAVEVEFIDGVIIRYSGDLSLLR